MAQRGHADDCSGCRYEDLPAADKATFDASLFTDHTRKPPPPEPKPDTTKGVLVMLGGALIGVIGLSGNALYGAVATIGLIVFIAGLVIHGRAQNRLSAARMRWRQAHEVWKAEQTKVWLQHRSRAELWPCPTCGDLSCSNQHSSTTTYRTGRRRYSSYTDPR